MPLYTLFLLDSNRFREIAGLVDIFSLADCDMICEQLQGYGCDQRFEAGYGMRQFYAEIGDFFYLGIAFVYKSDDLTVPSFYFLYVADYFLVLLVVRRYYDDGHVGIDEGYVAVFHFGGGITFCMDITAAAGTTDCTYA